MRGCGGDVGVVVWGSFGAGDGVAGWWVVELGRTEMHWDVDAMRKRRWR